ncbi:MAG: response regulator [Alphaproteobacteria bacterium]|nr:response regulator [Alphaproteobacteria bacterium]
MRGSRTANLVLVADDNEFVRFLIKKWLGDNAEIHEVGHGNDVVDKYNELQPDVLFLDIHLPGKNGKEILKEIMKKDHSAFVVMLSADSKKDNVVFTIQAGAKAFMTKPFTRQTLDKFYHMCPTISHAEGMIVQGTESVEHTQMSPA